MINNYNYFLVRNLDTLNSLSLFSLQQNHLAQFPSKHLNVSRKKRALLNKFISSSKPLSLPDNSFTLPLFWWPFHTFLPLLKLLLSPLYLSSSTDDLASSLTKKVEAIGKAFPTTYLHLSLNNGPTLLFPMDELSVLLAKLSLMHQTPSPLTYSVCLQQFSDLVLMLLNFLSLMNYFCNCTIIL